MPALRTRKGNLRRQIKFRRFLLKSKDPLVFLIRRRIGVKLLKRRLSDNIITLKKLNSKKKKR